MKVFLTIWILGALVQEVVPSTLVRLPRNAEKNLSLVHTEYEAKYEQKGKHGNESFSTVSGKQEIVHDNCAENWNTFADKCASLIKDLVASLANAVSSKPGDATNLQLHIKNTFKHFDNTHNCTCLNHSGRNISDLDLSPFFNNITIKTVHPNSKNSEKNFSQNKNKKCGETGQSCDGRQSSDSKSNKSSGIVNSGSNDLESDKNGSPQNQVKKCGQSGTEPCDGHDDVPSVHQLPQGNQKQLNHALEDDKDLEMNPENAEGSSGDQSTNNSRRQIKYPPNLEKPRKIYKNSELNSFSPNSNTNHPKNTKNARYPFLVTPRPISQSGKPSESPLSRQSSDSDSEPHNVFLPSISSVPTGRQHTADSSTDRNSRPNHFYLHQPSQTAKEPHSLFYNEGVPEESSQSYGPRTHQKPISVDGVKSPSKSLSDKNSQSPVVIVAEPVTESHNSEPEMPVSGNVVSRKPTFQAGEMVADKQNSAPLKSNHHLNTHSPVIVPEDQNTDDYISAPEQSINNQKSRQPVSIIPEEPVTDKQTSNDVPISQSPELVSEGQPIDGFSSKSDKEIPLQSVGRDQSRKMHPENPTAHSHALNPKVIPEQEGDQSSASSVVNPEESSNNKLNEQPVIVFPEKPSIDNSESGKEEPQPIVILPEETKPKGSAADPSAMDTEKTTENMSQEHPNSQNSASPVYVRNERPVEDRPMIKDDSNQPQKNPNFTMNEDSTNHKHSPNSHFNSNPPELLEPANKDQTVNPSHVESDATGSASNPSSKPLLDEDSANMSTEDTHPKHTDHQIVLEHFTTCAPTTTTYSQGGNDLDHTVSVIHTAPKAPETANQQSEDSIPTEEHILTTDQSPLIPQGFTVMPHNTQSREVYGSEERHKWDSKQSGVQEPTFSTLEPNYSGNAVTEIPDKQSKPRMTEEDYDPQEKETVKTDSPFVSSSEDQKQLDMENLPEETQNEHSSAPVYSEMKGTTPVAFYPVKSVPTEAQSAEQHVQMNDNSRLIGNENQESLTQEYFITPAPISTIKTTEVFPEQYSGNAENPKNENSVPSHAPNLHEEHFVTLLPTKSDDDEYTRVTVQSDNVAEKPTTPHSDHLSQENDFSFATTHSEPETAMHPPELKPSQPGVLVSTTEAQPHQREGQNLLIHPTTFQTTSEEPTPALGGSSGHSSLSRPTTSVPQDSDETIPVKPSTSPKTTGTYEHDDDDEEDCCSCESCTEEEITDPKLYRENACKNLEEARRELKAIFDKIKKKLKCGRKAPQAITAS